MSDERGEARSQMTANKDWRDPVHSLDTCSRLDGRPPVSCALDGSSAVLHMRESILNWCYVWLGSAAALALILFVGNLVLNATSPARQNDWSAYLLSLIVIGVLWGLWAIWHLFFQHASPDFTVRVRCDESGRVFVRVGRQHEREVTELRAGLVQGAHLSGGFASGWGGFIGFIEEAKFRGIIVAMHKNREQMEEYFGEVMRELKIDQVVPWKPGRGENTSIYQGNIGMNDLGAQIGGHSSDCFHEWPENGPLAEFVTREVDG